MVAAESTTIALAGGKNGCVCSERADLIRTSKQTWLCSGITRDGMLKVLSVEDCYLIS